MPIAIKDWVLELGFDASEVNRGLDKVEKRLARLGKMQNRLANPMGSQGQGPRGGGRKSAPKDGLLSDSQKFNLNNRLDALSEKASKITGKSRKEAMKLNKEIEELRAKIGTLGKNSAGLRKFNSQLRQTTAQVNKLTAASRKQTGANNALTQSFMHLGTRMASVFVILEAGKAVFNTIKQFDSLRSSLLAASGGAEAAAKDFQFIKDLANETGIELMVLADGYRQIGSASRASGMEAAEINKQFAQMSKVSRAFGLTAADTSLVMLAFQQMISKGVVSSEELRRQLGERLPGAVPQAAKAIGVTTLELSNMLKRGEVITKDFLPKFLNQMEEFVTVSGAYEASLGTVTAEQQRFNTALQESTLLAGDAGLTSALSDLFRSLTKLVGSTTEISKAFGAISGEVLTIFNRLIDLGGMLLSPINVIASLGMALREAGVEFRELIGLTQFFEGEWDSLGNKVQGWSKIIIGTIGLLVKKMKSFRSGESFDLFNTVRSSFNTGTSEGLTQAAEINKQRREAAARSSSVSNNSVAINPTIVTNDPEMVKQAMDEWVADSLHVALP